MTIIPITNAECFKITFGGTSERYTRTGTEGTNVRWEGRIGIFVDEKIVTGLNQAGEVNRTRITTILLPADMEPSFDLQEGDVISYEQNDPAATKGPDTFHRRVKSFTQPRAVPGVPSYYKVAVEDASA